MQKKLTIVLQVRHVKTLMGPSNANVFKDIPVMESHVMVSLTVVKIMKSPREKVRSKLLMGP